MPGLTTIDPPPPANSGIPGFQSTLLYNGSRFTGYQKSKGNSYDVEVVLQVSSSLHNFVVGLSIIFIILMNKLIMYN